VAFLCLNLALLPCLGFLHLRGKSVHGSWQLVHGTNYELLPIINELSFIMEITVKTAEQLRLTAEEFELIKVKLGRTPNFTELCSFSAMWSEHCSYKNSIKWLKTLPREGGKLLVAAGEENAGLMDMGNGFGVVFKI
jgi:hypothetical protein